MSVPGNNHGCDGSTAMSSLEIAAADDLAPHMTPPNIEDRYHSEREQSKIRHWKESEYAAGLVEQSWSDEMERHRRRGECCCGQMFQEEVDPGCGCVYLSALVCSRLGARRIGNMAVLKERYVMVEVEDEDENHGKEGQENMDGFVDEEEPASLQQRINNSASSDQSDESANEAKRKRVVRKREIQLIVGPFWPMLLFITYPLIFVVSALTMYKGLPGRPLYAQIGWALLTGQLIRSLFNTGFRDPGILARHERPPIIANRNSDSEDDDERPQRRVGFRWGNETGPWRWSDQAQTYRPRNSMFCPDCKVIIEDFDHTCPWTGTAIGKKNMGSFQCFVGLVFACLILDIFLLTVASVE